MIKKTYVFLLPATMALLGSVTMAFAESSPDNSPQLHGSVLFEIQNDWAYDSDDRDAELNDLYTTIEPYLVFQLNDRFAVETSLVVEPVQDPDAAENSYFDNEGIFVEEFKLVFQGDRFTAQIGKYNPAFGTAWDIAPGIWGVDFAEDYELTERIGAAVSIPFETAEWGSHSFTGGTFFSDVSFLSNAWGTKRAGLDKADGGAGNTEDFSSYALALDSENIAGINGLNTHIAYRHQEGGITTATGKDEEGVAVGMNYAWNLSDTVHSEILLEWAGLNNSGGTQDDVDYMTAGLVFTVSEAWNFAFSYTGRNTDVFAGNDTSDYLYQLSAGYAFDNGISLDMGYRQADEAGVTTYTAGGLLAYTYEF